MSTTTTTPRGPDAKPRKTAGYAGNRNRMRHGVRAFLALGRAPKGSGYIYRLLGKLRLQVEQAVLAKHDELSLYHAMLVQSLVRHEGRCQLLTRWLREATDLTLADRLAVLKEIGAATDARDKCAKGLELDKRRDADVWATLSEASDDAHSDEGDEGDPEHPSDENASSEAVGDDKPVNEIET